MQIVDMDLLLDCTKTEFVGGAYGLPAFNSAPAIQMLKP